jgi:PqqD family protein of HPr-rel-A system
VRLLEAQEGTLIQPLGNAWAAYSAHSGETHLMNHEGAALLEALLETPRTLAAVAELLAGEVGVPPAGILPLLADAAIEFQSAGLIRAARTR